MDPLAIVAMHVSCARLAYPGKTFLGNSRQVRPARATLIGRCYPSKRIGTAWDLEELPADLWQSSNSLVHAL